MNNEENRNMCMNERNTVREEMIMKIRELDFAIVELGLYLDTHPEDQRALCLHREYSRQLKDLKDKYQKVYGPLTIYYPCNKWRWLEEPWASYEKGGCVLSNFKITKICFQKLTYKTKFDIML